MWSLSGCFWLVISFIGLFVENNLLLFSKELVIIQGFMKSSSFYCNIYKTDSRIAIHANENFNTLEHLCQLYINC